MNTVGLAGSGVMSILMASSGDTSSPSGMPSGKHTYWFIMIQDNNESWHS